MIVAREEMRETAKIVHYYRPLTIGCGTLFQIATVECDFPGTGAALVGRASACEVHVSGYVAGAVRHDCRLHGVRDHREPVSSPRQGEVRYGRGLDGLYRRHGA